jgi:PAS domain S-box-containing protein
MLSSAKKSVPTLKQFIQPYFIEIAPDGAIAATCTRFVTILEKNNIYNHLGKNIVELFLQLGTLDTKFDTSSLSRTAIPRSIDLSVNRPGSRSFLIRWTPTPANEPVEGGWQFTGVRIHMDIAAIVPGIVPTTIPVISAKKRSAGTQRKAIKKHGLFLADLVKYVSDIIVSTDTQFQIMQWNKAAEKCYGISARHAIGKNFRELISYEYVNSTQQEAERSFLERGYWEGETVYLSPNGKKSYLLCSVRTMRDSRENIIGIVAINKDITENKRAQEEIIRIKTAIDNTSDAISITDINFKVIYQNPSHQRMFRRTTRQWNSENGILNCIRQPVLTRKMVAELRSGRSWSGDVKAYDKSGSAIDLALRSDSIQDRAGGSIGYIWSFTDIRERKRSEAQLHEYSEQITIILERFTDGFFVLDKNLRVELWNQEAERLTGLSPEEMIGAIIWEKWPEMAGDENYLSLHRALKKKVTVNFEQYNERRDRWLETSVYPSAQGLFVYFKDITARKKQEAMMSLEKKVLELNSNKKSSLQAIVNYFLKGIEKIFPEMYCSVLTLDDDGLAVRHLSSPRLPAIYSHAIDGLPIGPEAGSCGTAMFRKEKVVVSDIETDPLWAGARELALQFGLRACWSLPVLNAKGDVLAAFATYYTSAKSPTEVDLDIVGRAANIVRIILENNRAEEDIKASNERYMLATRATNDAIWDWDMNAQEYFWGEGFYQQFGYRPGSKVRTRKFWESHLHPEDRDRILKELERFIQRKDKGLWLEEYRFRRVQVPVN